MAQKQQDASFSDQNTEIEDLILSNEELTLKNLHSPASGTPYQLINATLNVPGSKNRWLRGRKADIFFFSMFYCGANCTGYRSTEEYERGKTRLATAMAISGAAASPQMGGTTGTFTAFLLGLLNIRLNRLMPNPNRDPGHRLVIKVWPFYFLKEIFNRGDENDRFLNLSDGGHYENLGVFELIRRKCSLIIASDAGADPEFAYGDLANLIRKVRIDLGVEIKIDLSNLRQKGEEKNTCNHFAVGRIEYPDGKVGTLLYLKSSIKGDEPEDLLAYRRKNRAFPDQSTLDQFFDESQFESYRELGYLIGRGVFAKERCPKDK